MCNLEIARSAEAGTWGRIERPKGLAEKRFWEKRRISGYWLGTGHYPRATSSVIMTANPNMAPTVAMSLMLSNCDSGMSSSTTT